MIEGADQPPGTGFDEPDRRSASAAQIGFGPVGRGPEPPGGSGSEQSPADEIVEHNPDRFGRAEQRQVGFGQGQLRGSAAQLRAENVGVARVQHGGLYRPAEDRLGVVHEIGVERIVAGHEHRQCALAGPAGAARLLPDRGHRARPAGEQHGVQPGDIDPELQRVGGRDPQQLAGLQPSLELASILGKVTAAVGRDPVRQLRYRFGEGPPSPQSHRLRAAPRADEGDRPSALDDQIGQQVGGLGSGGPADRYSLLSAEAGLQGRFPEGEHGRPAGRGIGGDRHHRMTDEPGGGHLRIADGGRRQDEHRVRSVPGADPPQPPQDVRDMRSEHAAVGMALVDHDEAQAAQKTPELVVPRQDAAVQHVGVGEHQGAKPAHPVAILAGGVAVVGGGVHPRQVPGLYGPQLIGREGLGRREVHRRGRVVGEQRRQRGQQVGERLPAGRAGRQHDRTAGPGQLGGGRLVLPRCGDPAAGQLFDEQRSDPARPGSGSSWARRDVLDMGDPIGPGRIAQQPLQPGRAWTSRRSDQGHGRGIKVGAGHR